MVRKFARRTTRRNTRRVPRANIRRKRTTRATGYTRRRTYAKRTVTNRRILNVSTVKKQDTLLGSGPAAPDITYNPYNGITATGTGGNPSVFMWCPTYRNLSNAGGTIYNQRGVTRTYYRGVKENIEFYLPSNTPVQWRRIVVGTQFNVNATASYSFNNPNTYGRTQSANATPYYAFLEILFQGSSGNDWNNVFAAKTDAKRNHIYYDKTRTITPQSTGGAIRKFRHWHAVNKPLVYDDEEQGGTIASSPYAANTPGNENIYIIDIMVNHNTTSTAQLASWAVNTTTYWHER